VKNKSAKETKGEPFEKLMAAIQMAFHPDDKVEHNIKKRQSSGVNRQIDVSVSGRNIIVECRDKSRKVTLSEMDSFIRLCETTKSEGIFVSRKGFAPNVIKNANEANIKTFTLSEINNEKFRDNFYIPPIDIICLHHKYEKFSFVIDQGYTPGITLDQLVYDINGNAMTAEGLVKPNYETYMNWNLLEVFYKPLTDKISEKVKNQEDYQDELRNSAVVKEELLLLPKNKYFVKQIDGMVPIMGIILNISVRFTIQEMETQTYQQKDINGTLFSQTSTSDLFQKEKLFSLTVVNTGNPLEPAVTLVPRFRSSEILKVPKLN
jgi:hypothetical protein